MTTREILPQPESAYQLLLDAARTWPDGIATQWIPAPADPTCCLAWTYAELAGTVTRIANALTTLGVRRADAVTLSSVNTSMLYAATLAAEAAGIAAPVNPALSAERIAELIRRTGSRVLVAAGPELDPQLWQRLLGVARQAGMTAVLALRPDGAHSDPPPLAGDAPAGGTLNGRGPVVAYLDDVIAGQPSDRLAGAEPPAAEDLAAFVHTGGTTGAPKIAAHTHANQLVLRPRHRRVRRAGARRGDAGRAAAVPRQRADRHRHRPDVQRRPGSVAGPGGLPRQGPVRPVLDDRRALPDRGDVRRPHRLRHAGPGSGRRRHQHAAAADRRCVPAAGLGSRGLRPAHRAASAGGLRAHRGDLRQHLDQAGRGTARVGRPRPARAADQGRPDRRRRVLDRLRPRRDRRADDRRARRVRRVRHRPGPGRPPGQPGRRRPGRLAGHRRPRQRRRRRLRLPHRPGQGPGHPRRSQHRPPGHRGRAAGPSRRRRRRGRRPPGPARRRGPGGLRRPGRPRPVRRGRPAGLGRHRHRRARRPAQAHLPGRRHPGHRGGQAVQARADRRRRRPRHHRGAGRGGPDRTPGPPRRTRTGGWSSP